MAPRLVVDTRERALIDALKLVSREARTLGYAPKGHESEEALVESMDLADVEIRDGETYNLYERKTLRDLAASIKDTRYRSQKARLRDAMLEGVRVEYVLELTPVERRFLSATCADANFRGTGMSAAALRGAVYNTQCRDQMHVHLSSSVEETARYVYEHWSRMLRFTGKKRDRTQEQLDITQHKKRKQENATAHTRFIAMLCCAQGVSHTVASAVATHFRSMSALVEAFREITPQSDEKKLKKQCVAVFKDLKGVGPTLAYSLWAMLTGREL